MFEDADLEPRKRAVPQKDLSPMSVEDLREYIENLKAEIARAEAAIERKNSHRSGAEALFGR